VTFELTDLLNDQEEVSETYSTDSFAYLDDYGITSEFKSRIYYPNIDGSGLIEDYVTLDASSNESLEQQIVEYLYKGDGKSYVGSISSDTAINMISVSDGVCFLDFSKEFLDGIEGINYDLILYSIVDSLTVLKNVNSVDISVDGNRQLMLGENIDLSLSYESDLSYVK
jgi:germination protein M